MPIYDYECTSCGLKKEVMRKISEPNLTICPACHEATFAKQVSAPSFQLNGTGWYATDFKGSGAKPSSDSESNVKANTTDTTAEIPKPAAACVTGCACH